MSTTWLAQATIRVCRLVIAAGAAGLSAWPIWGRRQASFGKATLAMVPRPRQIKEPLLDVPPGSPAITPALHHTF